MKTKHVNFKVITHDKNKNWRWFPRLTNTDVVYEMDNMAWTVPVWQFTFLFMNISYIAYGMKSIYKCGKGVVVNHSADVLQDRVVELEDAIRNHRDSITHINSVEDDRHLWKTLKE